MARASTVMGSQLIGSRLFHPQRRRKSEIQWVFWPHIRVREQPRIATRGCDPANFSRGANRREIERYGFHLQCGADRQTGNGPVGYSIHTRHGGNHPLFTNTPDRRPNGWTDSEDRRGNRGLRWRIRDHRGSGTGNRGRRVLYRRDLCEEQEVRSRGVGCRRTGRPALLNAPWPTRARPCVPARADTRRRFAAQGEFRHAFACLRRGQSAGHRSPDACP